MMLQTDEFIRRFLIHVLPSGFHRIRHYGLFANGGRAENLAREPLDVPAPQEESDDADANADGPRRGVPSVGIDHHAASRSSATANWPPELVALTTKPVLEFEPLHFRRLAARPATFRRLFRSERVDEREGLEIHPTTFLFTDIKGSTGMYERLGDLNAYALVREHFALLDSAAQRHGGATVKTIGDAVMAVFSRPTDAISAALRILDDIERFNGEHGGPGIILRAHCGPSIAVTLNDNLDYFGQSVNVAARVQSLVDTGDGCITEALYTAPGVSDLLASHEVVEFDAPLGSSRRCHCTKSLPRYVWRGAQS